MEILKKETSVVMVNGKATEITLSDKEIKELDNELIQNSLKGMDLYFANCELITAIRNSNGYYALGYDSFKEYASERFEQGETQAKNMCLIAQNFGTNESSDKVHYTIVDKDLLKQYTATQLIEIKGLKNFEAGKFAECLKYYGIKPSITCSQLRALKQAEKNHDKALTFDEFSELSEKVEKAIAKAEESKSEKATAKAEESKSDKKSNEQLEKEIASVNADKERLERVNDTIKGLLAELQILVTSDKGKKLSDKDFRAKVTDLVINLGK